MFTIHIGNTEFEIYPLLDANEVIMKLHEVMRALVGIENYKTFIAISEKYTISDEKTTKSIDTYTLVILKSYKYLKANEIALLFKEIYKKRNDRGMLHGH